MHSMACKLLPDRLKNIFRENHMFTNHKIRLRSKCTNDNTPACGGPRPVVVSTFRTAPTCFCLQKFARLGSILPCWAAVTRGNVWAILAWLASYKAYDAFVWFGLVHADGVSVAVGGAEGWGAYTNY